MPGRDGGGLWPALLLLGPTGSGKTPLGDYLARHGLHGRSCVHFDFGANLRAAAAGGLGGGLSARALTIVQRSLATAALLEDDEFFVVRELLAAFLAATPPGPDGWVVLNGMPRHAGQAAQCAELLDVQHVVVLECSPATVLARLQADSGGDRAGRTDDAEVLVRHKLAVYEARTRPLVRHYAAAGAGVVVLPVAADTQPADLAAPLEGSIP